MMNGELYIQVLKCFLMNIILILISLHLQISKLNTQYLFSKCYYYLCKTKQFLGWIIIIIFLNNNRNNRKVFIWTLLTDSRKYFMNLIPHKYFIILNEIFLLQWWLLVGCVDWSLIISPLSTSGWEFPVASRPSWPPPPPQLSLSVAGTM